MTRPTRRNDSASHQFKMRTPKALLASRKGERISFRLPDQNGADPLVVTTTIGDVIKFSLRTREDAVAKLRCAAVNEQVELLAASAIAGPQPLTHKQRTALAGLVYRDFASALEDDPASPDIWTRVQEQNRAALAGTDDALESRFRPFVDVVLQREGILTDAASREALLSDVGRALTDAAAKLQRNAEGDYSPDPAAVRFPSWGGAMATPAGAVSIASLIEGWSAEAKRLCKSPSTIDGYSRIVRQFAAFLGHDDATRVTREDVARYKTKRLVTDGKSAKTVQAADLVAIKAVFRWGIENHSHSLKTNPAQGLTLKVPKNKKQRGYSDKGALTILRAALSYQRAKAEAAKMAAAKRWIVWVCAFTGARVGEIIQLRKADLRHNGEAWSIWITPEAGRVKDKEEREVPLHPQLVEIGFVDFVQAAADGYLFIKADGKGDSAGGIQSTINRLGEFARSLVVEDRVPANHGWRHRFITLCRRHGVDLELRRKITGHAGEGVDEESYGDVEGLYREICKLPPYGV